MNTNRYLLAVTFHHEHREHAPAIIVRERSITIDGMYIQMSIETSTHFRVLRSQNVLSSLCNGSAARTCSKRRRCRTTSLTNRCTSAGASLMPGRLYSIHHFECNLNKQNHRFNTKSINLNTNRLRGVSPTSQTRETQRHPSSRLHRPRNA